MLVARRVIPVQKIQSTSNKISSKSDTASRGVSFSWIRFVCRSFMEDSNIARTTSGWHFYHGMTGIRWEVGKKQKQMRQMGLEYLPTCIA